mmetsp:Transcript_25743/g.64856  ORF Transcript_25743/g.64856 Transcript_25743/m.64856 type:complete len:286 (-) Transcript_25743:2460-3317(-)
MSTKRRRTWSRELLFSANCAHIPSHRLFIFEFGCSRSTTVTSRSFGKGCEEIPGFAFDGADAALAPPSRDNTASGEVLLPKSSILTIFLGGVVAWASPPAFPEALDDADAATVLPTDGVVFVFAATDVEEGEGAGGAHPSITGLPVLEPGALFSIMSAADCESRSSTLSLALPSFFTLSTPKDPLSTPSFLNLKTPFFFTLSRPAERSSSGRTVVDISSARSSSPSPFSSFSFGAHIRCGRFSGKEYRDWLIHANDLRASRSTFCTALISQSFICSKEQSSNPAQ